MAVQHSTHVLYILLEVKPEHVSIIIPTPNARPRVYIENVGGIGRVASVGILVLRDRSHDLQTIEAASCVRSRCRRFMSTFQRVAIVDHTLLFEIALNSTKYYKNITFHYTSTVVSNYNI